MATYKTLPADTAKRLRKHGLKVVVVPGWKTRKTNSWSNGFDPVGVLCHHTATSAKWSLTAVLRLLTGGRPGLSGPLCNFGLGRDGTVYLIAAGRANHAGSAKSVGTVSAGDGNFLYIGVEAFNDGVGEPWPAEQYDAYVLLCAALSEEITGNSARTIAAHKETSYNGKVDVRFNMDTFRKRVAEKILQISKPAPKPTKMTRGLRVDQALALLNKTVAAGQRKKKIQAAAAALTSIKKYPEAER